MFKSILILAVSVTLFWTAQASAEDIAVIVNARLDVNAISLDDVREVYRGKIQFLSGKRLKPIDQSENQEIRKAFLTEVLRLSKSDYTKHWMHLVFLEGTNAPVLRDDSTGVIQAVQESEGGIGYVWASEAANAKGVKTILIIHTTAKKMSQSFIPTTLLLPASLGWDRLAPVQTPADQTALESSERIRNE
jgi:ABC-type phosphate transport system substrate-binding protein